MIFSGFDLEIKTWENYLKAKPFSASGELFIYMEAAFTVIKCFEIKGKKKKKTIVKTF